MDQYGVQADAVLYFTPMHKVLRLQLPDLRYLDCKVDFSIKTFNAVVQLCRELGKSVVYLALPRYRTTDVNQRDGGVTFPPPDIRNRSENGIRVGKFVRRL